MEDIEYFNWTNICPSIALDECVWAEEDVSYSIPTETLQSDIFCGFGFGLQCEDIAQLESYASTLLISSQSNQNSLTWYSL
jgi:hypothetical protein